MSLAYFSTAGGRTGTRDLPFDIAPLLELRELPTGLEVYRIHGRHFNESDKIAESMNQREDAKLQIAPIQFPYQYFLFSIMHLHTA